MLALALIDLKSWLKFVAKVAKNRSYPPCNYLLSFCLHKINIFYPAY